MRNGRIPNLGTHQTVMAGEYPKAGDKRPHKLTECEKKKVCSLIYPLVGVREHLQNIRITLLEEFDLHNT